MESDLRSSSKLDEEGNEQEQEPKTPTPAYIKGWLTTRSALKTPVVPKIPTTTEQQGKQESTLQKPRK